MVRFRFGLVLGLGLMMVSTLGGCFGTPFDKGDGMWVGTGRPAPTEVDQARTGGLGSPRGQEMIGPGDLSTKNGAAPGVGAK